MFAFKVVMTTLLTGLVIICGFVGAKETEKANKYIGFSLGLIMAASIAAIWL